MTPASFACFSNSLKVHVQPNTPWLLSILSEPSYLFYKLLQFQFQYFGSLTWYPCVLLIYWVASQLKTIWLFFYFDPYFFLRTVLVFLFYGFLHREWFRFFLFIFRIDQFILWIGFINAVDVRLRLLFLHDGLNLGLCDFSNGFDHFWHK